MSKHLPQWRFIVYPHGAIPQRKVDAFAVADILADVVARRPSSWGGVLARGADGNKWGDWARLGPGVSLVNAAFVRFLPDGGVAYDANQEGGGAGGFTILPVDVPLPVAGDTKTLGELAAPVTAGGTGGEAGGSEAGGGETDGPNPDVLAWKVEPNTFEASRALTSTGTTALLSTGNPAATVTATTAQPWPKGQGIVVDVTLIGTREQKKQANCLITVSENLRVALRQGQPPALERRVLERSGGTAREKWANWRKMDGASAVDTRDAKYKIGLHVVANRLTWEVNGSSLWMMDTAVDGSKLIRPAGVPKPEFERTADMAELLGGVPLRLATENLRIRLEVAKRVFSEADGSPRTGTVTRTITKTDSSGARLEPQAAGNLPHGTEMPVQVMEERGVLTYSVTLSPSEDGMQTPFCSQVYLAYAPVWTGGSEVEGIDISSCVTRATLSHAHPPLQSGYEGSVTIDLALIKLRMPSALPLLRDYHPVEIQGRWDGGVLRGGAWRPGEWQRLVKGFFLGVSGEQRGFHSATLTLSVRGPMARLRKPAALVDAQCMPLDFFYNARLKALRDQRDSDTGRGHIYTPTYNVNGNIIANGPIRAGDEDYYGADAVRDIIAHFLGPDAVARFNGNGAARRFLPAGHLPLISKVDMEGSWLAVAEAYGQKLTAASVHAQNKATMMPPFGEDGLRWINQLAADEYNLFTEGYLDRDAAPGEADDWPALIYGTREEILSFAKLHRISGKDASELLAQAASYETKPENDINRILVWGKPWGQENPWLPATVQGEARFRPLHPRSAERTWMRTAVLETPMASSPARAQSVAAIALMEAEGETFRFPSYTVRGDADCMTGDVFTASDVGLLGGEDMWFRAASIGHEYTAEGENKDWVTNIALQTMSISEIRRFERSL